MPLHPAFTGFEDAEALVFVDSGRHDRGLLSDDSLTNYFRIHTISNRIVNQPTPRQQLRGELTNILDADEVRENVMALRWLRVIAQVHGAHCDADSFGLAVIECPRSHDWKLNIAALKNERGAGLSRRLANFR
jgi:hypothetical protein